MYTLDVLQVEDLLEKALERATGKSVSVLSLGNEWSVNVDGKLFFNFVVDEEGVHEVPVLQRPS